VATARKQLLTLYSNLISTLASCTVLDSKNSTKKLIHLTTNNLVMSSGSTSLQREVHKLKLAEEEFKSFSAKKRIK